MLRTLLAALVVWMTLAGPALAQRRVALVVGMGKYESLPRLDNPGNDARLVAETLKDLGFTLIGGSARIDLDRSGFERAVRDFGRELQNAEVGLFYYAGHGLQVSGANWLIPVSANPTRPQDLPFEMVEANLVLQQMEGSGTKLNVLILDACRNNPYGWRGLRDVVTGLAQMRAPEGTLISFATDPGNVAADGTDGNSPYTKALARQMKTVGLDIQSMFNEVGVDVMTATRGLQRPWLSSTPLKGRFYLAGAAPGQGGGLPFSSTAGSEHFFWFNIKDSTTPSDFREYLRQYPNGAYANLARNRIYETDPEFKELNEAIRRSPNDASAYSNRAWKLYFSGDYDRAIEDFSKAISLKPDDAELFRGRGVAYREKDQYDRALSDFNRAVGLDPANSVAFSGRAVVYSFLDQEDRAIADWDKVVSLKPDDAYGWAQRGSTYQQKKEYDRAIVDLDKAIGLRPDYAFALTFRGVVRVKKGQYDLAIEDLDKAISLDPDDAFSFAYRGEANRKKGDFARAIRDFDRALQLKPSSDWVKSMRADAVAGKR